MALNVDTHKNQNLEFLWGSADFHFCVGTQDVPFLHKFVSTSSVAKINITDKSLIQLRLLWFE